MYNISKKTTATADRSSTTKKRNNHRYKRQELKNIKHNYSHTHVFSHCHWHSMS